MFSDGFAGAIEPHTLSGADERRSVGDNLNDDNYHDHSRRCCDPHNDKKASIQKAKSQESEENQS